jgi:alkylation response protein AidB-like acyl-CoA dehydrogenase
MTEETGALSPDEAETFRTRCRTFLESHAVGIPTRSEGGNDQDILAATKTFQQALTDAGLAGLTYPVEFGGQGLTKAHERIFREEYANYPEMTGQLVISHGMCLPVLNDFGSDELKRTYMPGNISGEHLWCQMFSEPGAGSDVASLQTRAERDGDEYIINGQKVWTTLAHVCDFGVLIARTDPDQPKHAGISMFMVDMSDPAVEVRPINQIDGGSHFNEVFFTDLRIPASWLLGDYNDGWRQATAMLMYERVAIGAGSTSGVVTPVADRLIERAREMGRAADPLVRQQLTEIYSHEFAKSLVAMRTRAAMKAGRAPGPGGSLGKLHGARISAMTRSVNLEIAGPSGVAWLDEDAASGAEARGVLSSFASSIAGGTDEIQKNIIGDRVLGLPREPSIDKGVPFRDLLVGTQS